MVLAVAPDNAAKVTGALEQAGERVHMIGEIVSGERGCTVTGSAETWAAREDWQATHNA